MLIFDLNRWHSVILGIVEHVIAREESSILPLLSRYHMLYWEAIKVFFDLGSLTPRFIANWRLPYLQSFQLHGRLGWIGQLFLRQVENGECVSDRYVHLIAPRAPGGVRWITVWWEYGSKDTVEWLRYVVFTVSKRIIDYLFPLVPFSKGTGVHSITVDRLPSSCKKIDNWDTVVCVRNSNTNYRTLIRSTVLLIGYHTPFNRTTWFHHNYHTMAGYCTPPTVSNWPGTVPPVSIRTAWSAARPRAAVSQWRRAARSTASRSGRV